MLRALLSLLVLAWSTVACATTSQDDACPGGFPQSGWNRGLEVAGQRREVYALLPTQTGPRPLLIAFNGTTENGQSFARRARLQDYADRGFVVLAPSSAGNGTLWPVWDAMRPPGEEDAPNADLALFDGLLACAQARLEIDASRIYVAGHSAGGSMTNHLLQRRSSVLAGGIVGSGVYDGTRPGSTAPLDPMAVIVTWGGANDQWSGLAGGVLVRRFGFWPEAVAAAQRYAEVPGGTMVACQANDQGHVWLDELNGWMADTLLAHPRGQAGAPVALPSVSGVRCQTTPPAPPPGRTLDCGEGGGCAAACGLIADCAALNTGIDDVLRRELDLLGFAEVGTCDTCLARCAGVATQPQDAAVLACVAEVQQAQGMFCGQGISGARPLMTAINTCCAGQTESGWCQEVCGAMMENTAARGYFPACRGI